MTTVFDDEQKDYEHCNVCGSKVWIRAQVCPSCKLPREQLTRCSICRQPMPYEAERCNACQSYRGFLRRHLGFSQTTLALLTALGSMFLAVESRIGDFTNRHSHTSITVMRADPSLIYVNVSNSGLAPSTLRTYRLTSSELDIDPVQLELGGDDKATGGNVIPGRGQSRIALLVRGLTGPHDLTSMTQKLRSARVMLTVSVEESNGRFDRFDSFDGSLIRPIIDHKYVQRRAQ
jgi:hypothetical protein